MSPEAFKSRSSKKRLFLNCCVVCSVASDKGRSGHLGALAAGIGHSGPTVKSHAKRLGTLCHGAVSQCRSGHCLRHAEGALVIHRGFELGTGSPA